jgi:hypothetical protein
VRHRQLDMHGLVPYPCLARDTFRRFQGPRISTFADARHRTDNRVNTGGGDASQARLLFRANAPSPLARPFLSSALRRLRPPDLRRQQAAWRQRCWRQRGRSDAPAPLASAAAGWQGQAAHGHARHGGSENDTEALRQQLGRYMQGCER